MTVFRDNPISSELDTPLYQQLYTHLRTAILIGDLKTGTRLPSTRALAPQLNVSRNTVLNAYQQLIAEGYLDGMVGNGTFVARILPDHLLASPQLKEPVETSSAEPDKPRFSEQATLQLALPACRWPPHLRQKVHHAPFTLAYQPWEASLTSYAASALEPVRRRKKFELHTPAMALGLTDQIWSVQNILLTPVFSLEGRDKLMSLLD